LNKILKPIDPNVIKQDAEVKTHNEAITNVVSGAIIDLVQNVDDANWHAHREIKFFNLNCQGTESSLFKLLSQPTVTSKLHQTRNKRANFCSSQRLQYGKF